MSRRNRFTMIEDTFADMTLDEQNRLLPILVGLNRQKTRNGASLADRTPAPAPAKPPTQAQELFERPAVFVPAAVCPHGAESPQACAKCLAEAFQL